MAQLERLGELRKLTQPVSARLELTAIGDKLLRAGGLAVLCGRVVGHTIPCLVSLFGTLRRVALGMGADPATIPGAVTPVPDTLSEYQFAGLLRGSRTASGATPPTTRTTPASRRTSRPSWGWR